MSDSQPDPTSIPTTTHNETVRIEPNISPYKQIMTGLILAMIATVLSLIVGVTIAILGVRDRAAADQQVEALRERVVLTETRLEKTEARVACFENKDVNEAIATNAAQGQLAELVIEAAEQLDLVFRGEQHSPDALRTQITATRTAYQAAAQAAAVDASVQANC